MNLNKALGRVATTFVAATMLAAFSAVPASAITIDDNGVATTNEKTITLNQTIDVSNAENANTPVVTFTYKIEGNNDMVGARDSLPVHPGIMPTDVSGDWTVTAVFDGSEEKVGNFVKDTFTIDFTSVQWTGVGVYRYKLTQSNNNKAVDLDTNTSRYLDVYVGNGDTAGQYKVLYYVLTTDGMLTFNSSVGNTYDHGNKSSGFTANYDTYTLTVKKYVTGDMGSKNDTFDFTVNFSNLPTGAKVYDGSKLVEGGNVTGNLKDGGTIVITGIPAVGSDGNAVSYVVSEKFATAKGYSTQYEVNADITKWDGNNAENPTSTSETENTVMTAARQKMNADENNYIEFNNSRTSVTPTGIVMNVAPYVLLVVVAAAGCFVFLRKRRED